MARSADGSLRDRQQIRGKSGIVQAGRGPLFRLAGNRAKTPGALGNTGRPCLGVVPRSTRTPSSTSAQPQPRAAEVHEGQVIARSLLVASGDGTRIRKKLAVPFPCQTEVKLGVRAAGSAPDGTCAGAPLA